MKNMKIGDNYTIHCYKHDGSIHRSWDEAILLDVSKEFLVFGNNHAMVNNSDLPLEKDSVKAVYKKVADIINNDSRIDHTHKLSSYDEYSDNDGR